MECTGAAEATFLYRLVECQGTLAIVISRLSSQTAELRWCDIRHYRSGVELPTLEREVVAVTPIRDRLV